jgi:FecR protein
MSIPIPAILVALGVTGVAAAAAVGGFLLLSGGEAQASSTVLTILSGNVQIEEAGSGSLRAAVDGEVLDEGDRVVTGEDAHASITFFEGSTQVLEPGTDVTIEAVGSTDGGGLLADVSQAAGTTWNTVLDSSSDTSDVQVEGPAAAAAVRDTMFDVNVLEDGTTGVWTRQGTVSFTGMGEEQLVGQGSSSTAQQGSPPGLPGDAPVKPSELRVLTEGPAWLLISDPRSLASGCAPEGIPVNQIRLTVITDCLGDAQSLSLLTLTDGQYELYLSAHGAGDFRVAVDGLTDDEVVCDVELTGAATEGERWRATLDLEVVDERIVSCVASELELTE